MTLRPLTRDEARSIDQRALQEYGIPGLVLMENAGRNAAGIIAARYAESNRQVCIVCGKGNNAGDGFVIARILKMAGYTPTVVLTEDPETLSSDARFNFKLITGAEFDIDILHADEDLRELTSRLQRCDVIVDALIGTGLRGIPGGRLAEIIGCINTAKMNRSRIEVVSVDIPSGLDCDLGTVGDPQHSSDPAHTDQSTCVKADLTVTFVAEKAGFSNPTAADFLGEVIVADIGAPAALLREYQT
jgi:NAD(P)H-hydrate epimerase